MKFEVTRDIENRVFSVNIAYAEMGNESLSAETELEIYKDFGYPKVDVGGQFASDTGGVTFVLNKKDVVVDEKFSITHSVKIDKIAGEEDARIALAEATCKLFEDVIIARLEEAVIAVQARASSFSDGYPKDHII